MAEKQTKVSNNIEKLLQLRDELTLQRDILALEYEIKSLEKAITDGNFSSEESTGDSV